MADPFRHVSADDDFSPSASLHNATVDAVRAHRLGSLGGSASAAIKTFPPALVVRVRNDTGSDLPAGSVLAVGDSLIDPVSWPANARKRPLFAGTVPDSVAGPLVILDESLPSGWVSESEAIEAEDGGLPEEDRRVIGRAVIQGAACAGSGTGPAGGRRLTPAGRNT